LFFVKRTRKTLLGCHLPGCLLLGGFRGRSYLLSPSSAPPPWWFNPPATWRMSRWRWPRLP
jgi:hypothetical protein